MSVKHIGLVLDHFNTKDARLKLVAIILADHADSDGLCWPSYRKIAERANIHERSVQRHVKTLIELGIITKLRTGSVTMKDGKVQRLSNAYRVNAHIIINRMKLSTKPLGINDTGVYLEDDINDGSGMTQVSTKPSLNHQSNHQKSEPGDNSREPESLEEIFAQMIGGRTL